MSLMSACDLGVRRCDLALLCCDLGISNDLGLRSCYLGMGCDLVLSRVDLGFPRADLGLLRADLGLLRNDLGVGGETTRVSDPNVPVLFELVFRQVAQVVVRGRGGNEMCPSVHSLLQRMKNINQFNGFAML